MPEQKEKGLSSQYRMIFKKEGLLLSWFPEIKYINRSFVVGKPSFTHSYAPHYLPKLVEANGLSETELVSLYPEAFEDYNKKVERAANVWGLSKKDFEEKFKTAVFDSRDNGLIVYSDKARKQIFGLRYQDEQQKITTEFIKIIETGENQYEVGWRRESMR